MDSAGIGQRESVSNQILNLAEVAEHLSAFSAARDWSQFHTPKNLVMALTGEVGELVELLQWLTPEESLTIMEEPNRARAVEDEIADILQYLIRLADVLDVDLPKTLWRKLRENEVRYPAERSRGNAAKYTEFE